MGETQRHLLFTCSNALISSENAFSFSFIYVWCRSLINISNLTLELRQTHAKATLWDLCKYTIFRWINSFICPAYYPYYQEENKSIAVVRGRSIPRRLLCLHCSLNIYALSWEVLRLLGFVFDELSLKKNRKFDISLTSFTFTHCVFGYMMSFQTGQICFNLEWRWPF